ncbi:hypothetical protein [Brevundimonas aurifodinae]|uniref:Uncharacterized protein n=1 Tax=Brevundimonas aurifodinae TaxID=1508312 RepID=A0ABV1NN94_9CAUL
MSNLSTAQAFAWNLATTLMVCVVLFHCDAGYGVMPVADYDGDTASVIHEYDPFAI